MTSTIATNSQITGVRFAHAWRREYDGAPQATVHLGTATLYFDDPATARAVAAACVMAAAELEALPEDTPGGAA